MDATLFEQDESDSTSYQPRDTRGRLRGDERLIVKFATIPVKSAPETAAQGRPIFQDRDFISIKTPGDQHTVIETIATRAYFDRFPLDYQRFKDGQSNVAHGTPISELPGVGPSQVKELEALDIHTIEVLGEMGDELTRRHSGFATLKSRAADYLKRVNDAGYSMKQQAELEKRDGQIADLQAQMAELIKASKKASVKA